MESEIVRNPPKYHRDAEFTDPVVRCDKCQKLMLTARVKEDGKCPACGNRKIRNVLAMSGEEMKQLEAWNVDPDFIALFEETPDV